MSLHGEHVTGAAKRRRVQGGVVGKARAARRPAGTEDGKDHGGHALHVEFQGCQRTGALPVVGGGQHCGVGYELVQALAVPVLQMVEQHVEVLSFLRSSLPAVAEQVIEVPALSLPVCAVQRDPLEPQMAEQLVEVPTVLSVAVLQQQTVVLAVDIPVPHGSGRRRLQGSLPRQSSTAAGAKQTVDIPVRGGLHGFLPRQRSTQRTVEQLVDRSSGGLQDFHLGQGSAASSSGPADEALTGFFRTFPRPKEVRR